MQRHVRVRQTVFAAHLVDHCHVDEVLNLFFHLGETYVARKLLFEILHRLLRRQLLFFFRHAAAVSAIGRFGFRRFYRVCGTVGRTLRILRAIFSGDLRLSARGFLHGLRILCSAGSGRAPDIVGQAADVVLRHLPDEIQLHRDDLIPFVLFCHITALRRLFSEARSHRSRLHRSQRRRTPFSLCRKTPAVR